MPYLDDRLLRRQRSGHFSRSQAGRLTEPPDCLRYPQRTGQGNHRSRGGRNQQSVSLRCIAPMMIGPPKNWIERAHSFAVNRGTYHTTTPNEQVAPMNRVPVDRSGMSPLAPRLAWMNLLNHHRASFPPHGFRDPNLCLQPNCQGHNCGRYPGFDW